jgi:hypothetical protein
MGATSVGVEADARETICFFYLWFGASLSDSYATPSFVIRSFWHIAGFHKCSVPPSGPLTSRELDI